MDAVISEQNRASTILEEALKKAIPNKLRSFEKLAYGEYQLHEDEDQ